MYVLQLATSYILRENNHASTTKVGFPLPVMQSFLRTQIPSARSRVALGELPLQSSQLRVIPRFARNLSTGPSANTKSSNVPSFLAGAALATTLTFGALSFGSKSTSSSATTKQEGLYPKPAIRFNYATEFSQAIKELQEIFGPEQVTTDEDELKVHGVSPNSHHSTRQYRLCQGSQS